MTITEPATDTIHTGLPRLFVDIEEARLLLSTRRGFEETKLSPKMQDGIRRVFGEDLTADEAVARILEDVRQEGDSAVREYSLALQGKIPANLEVPRGAWTRAFEALDPELQDAFRLSALQIENFHRKQLRTSWMDYSPEGALGQVVRPLDRVGIYTPGGTAVYPSSLLMTAIPARVAGVNEIIVCSPSGPDGKVSPLVLAAAEVANVDRLFAVGGAQAIGAMAYGTATIPHVDKILGPGNIFVVLAKQQVYGIVDIDQLPGPTETLLVADETANPTLVAADMLAQAEHDPMATSILITCSPMLAHAVLDELPAQLAELERADIAGQSLAANGLIVITPDTTTAIRLANAYAPEHLCLLLNDPWSVVPQVRNAGGIFIGEDSPEAIGDYTAGPSHVMPTGGTARFSSPINVAEFTKVISVAALNKTALRRLGPSTAHFARAEGLTAHARAVERRLEALANEEED